MGMINPRAFSKSELLGSVYTGLLTNKTRHCNTISTPNKQWGGRYGLYARDDISTLQLIWGAWYSNDAFGEKALGASLTVTAAIEYPAGTVTQVKFGGSAQGSAASGANLTSDAVAISIPRGARFWLRYYMTSTAGMIYVGGNTLNYIDEANGDCFEFGASGVTDKTLSGTYTNTSAGQGFCSPPLAIVGPTRRPSFVCYGDSRFTGLMDRYGDAAFQHGEVERGIGREFAVSMFSQSSETAAGFASGSGARRMAMAAYASHAICGYGINDLGAGASTVQTRLAAVWTAIKAANPAIKVHQTTISPSTTSTDSWATLANQTVFSSESQRTAVNAYIRGQPAPLDGVLDIADVVESSRNSGKWATSLTADTSISGAWDGLHQTPLMCERIAAHAMFSPARFRRGLIAG